MSDSNSESSKLLSQLSYLAECSINQSPEEFLQMLPAKVCEYLGVPVCIVWIRDYETDTYKILATAGEVDEEYLKTELYVNHPGVHFSSEQKVFYLKNISQKNYRLADKEQLIAKGYKSLLSSPLKIKREVIGILNIYTNKIRIFKSWEKSLFLSIAQDVTIVLQRKKLVTENIIKEENLDIKERNLDSLNKKVRKLTEIILKITNTSKTKDLYKILLDGSQELVMLAKVAIARLNYRSGELIVVTASDQQLTGRSVKYGEGIIGECLENNQPRNINNIDSNSEIKNDYIPYWEDSKSVLIIPIVIDKVQVRIGTKITEGSKEIGILTLESSQVNAFNQVDQDLLISLACHTAIEIERIRSQRKLLNLRKIEQKIAQEKNSEKIMQSIVQGITKTLNFEMANISLVNRERTRIKSEHVAGIAEDKKSVFKLKADHSLASEDIQADIVRKKTIEVPRYDDVRFDQEVYNEFGHENLIRVFMPMVEALNELVIGTVEAGYNRKYYKYIYEWDVQILASFVNVAVQALEHRKLGWLDRITHELRSPLVGMRANASFLQKRFKQINDGLMYVKLNDIIEDSEMLLFQVRQLESYWRGRNYRKSKIERVYIARDIIIKTINQLQPAIKERGFSSSKIITPTFKHKIVYTDKIKLNQIIYNLLINAIKYAHSDPKKFKIIVEIEPTTSQFVKLRFKDWGIGVSKEFQDKIFDEGFREPAAMHKNVSGSGLGLFISRAIAREMKGDLKLVNLRNPTDFLLTVYDHKF